MAAQNAPEPRESLIADQYAVDPAQPLPQFGGGLPAFACHNRMTGQGGLMAIQAHRTLPPRARVLATLADTPVEGAVMPLAHGIVRPAGAAADIYAMVCTVPPGPPVGAAGRPWAERELIESLLLPCTLALDRLARIGVTHRAIRPDNLFRAGPNDLVVLGACFAAPPAAFQPAAYEPPAIAMALPAARGNGLVADDVYALGAVMLALAIGRAPLAGMPDADIVRRKIELGSLEALAGTERLPPLIADLLRGMLADDPDHRPTPAMLADVTALRVRRTVARPARRASRPLDVGGVQSWDARAAAHALTTQQDRAAEVLRTGAVDRWLRRSLLDAALGTRIEEAVRQRTLEMPGDDARADAMLVLRAVAILDPFAPLCWRQLTLWPDGFGTALAAHAEGNETVFQGLIASDGIGAWAAQRPDRCDEPMLRVDARQYRVAIMSRPAAGLARLRYVLNPMLPCASPLVAGSWVAELADLLPALERTLAQRGPRPATLIDMDIGAFVAARADQRLAALASSARGTVPRDPQDHLRLLAGLQTQFGPRALPGIAAWVTQAAEPLIAAWHNRERRQTMTDRLAELAQAGVLPPMLRLLEDQAARAHDTSGAQQARAAVTTIDAALETSASGGAARADLAARLGQEVAVGAGLVSLAVSIAAHVLG